MLQNDLYLRALKKEKVERTPAWMLRQAGRYLPEYREMRATTKNFMDFCRSPELCAKAVLQPIDRYGFDAAILFSDILTIPEAMGMDLQFLKGEGPNFSNPIRSEADLKQLKMPTPEVELKYVIDAVHACKSALQDRVPLIGFAGSPWTVGCYMVEGHTSKAFTESRGMVYSNPKLMHAILSRLAKATTDYLLAQIEAGADSVMIFDSWGGLLTEDTYQEFSLNYMQQIIEKLPAHIPTTLFSKGGGAWLELMADTGCTALGIDWSTNLADAKARVGHKVVLQGNLDPAALYGSAESIEREVKKVLAAYQGEPGHIFNLGHGIYPDVTPEAVQAMILAIRDN